MPRYRVKYKRIGQIQGPRCRRVIYAPSSQECGQYITDPTADLESLEVARLDNDGEDGWSTCLPGRGDRSEERIGARFRVRDPHKLLTRPYRSDTINEH